MSTHALGVYDELLREVVMRRNRRNAAAFRLEREQRMDLPLRRTTDFVEEEARVTRCSTFTVRGILYSAPSRLIGHRLKADATRSVQSYSRIA